MQRIRRLPPPAACPDLPSPPLAPSHPMQVSAAGGLEMVINHKLWQDVCKPFNFPATFTSRSFTMRRLYCQLLWHFEQLYMHGSSGPVLDSPFMPAAISGAAARGRGRGGVRRGRGVGRPQLQEGAGERVALFTWDLPYWLLRSWQLGSRSVVG